MSFSLLYPLAPLLWRPVTPKRNKQQDVQKQLSNNSSEGCWNETGTRGHRSSRTNSHLSNHTVVAVKRNRNLGKSRVTDLCSPSPAHGPLLSFPCTWTSHPLSIYMCLPSTFPVQSPVLLQLRVLLPGLQVTHVSCMKPVTSIWTTFLPKFYHWCDPNFQAAKVQTSTGSLAGITVTSGQYKAYSQGK